MLSQSTHSGIKLTLSPKADMFGRCNCTINTVSCLINNFHTSTTNVPAIPNPVKMYDYNFPFECKHDYFNVNLDRITYLQLVTSE